MASTSKTKLLTELLNLESVEVTKCQNLSQIGLILATEVLTKERCCDRCGKKSQKIQDTSKPSISKSKIYQ